MRTRHMQGCFQVEALEGRCLLSSANGSGGDMPAYYDSNLFTINFKELSPAAEASVLAHNSQINIIYMSDQAEAAGVNFTSVLDAMRGPGQGPGFNPLWQEVQVVFNPGVTPHQLTSDTAILAAVMAGQITLVPTTEVYRCSVIGPGPKGA
jgi:hypothetical protein